MQFSLCTLCLTAAFLVRSIVTAAPASMVDTPQPNYLFSFGDSYTATGFVDWGTLPSPGNPLGNPPIPLTITGGPYWINYITTTYNQSLTLTYNLAVDGATTNASLVPPWLGITLEDEVESYIKKFSQRPPSTPWESDNTLFSIWIGINDIYRTYNNDGDRDAFSDQVLDSYFNLVELLYACYSNATQTGARMFYFINVPPIDRTPVMLEHSISDQNKLNTVIQGWNNKLQERISNFGQDHDDVKIWTWDSHAVFTTILDNPADYGFKDVTSWSLIDSSYFWGNDFHPGSAAHNIFAQNMRDSLMNFPW